MSDDFRMLMTNNDETSRRDNEHIWNVFSQLLVPLIILMTFAVVMELTQYQKTINETNADNFRLQMQLKDVEKTPKGTLAERATTQLIEAQKQKLLAFMWVEIAKRRGPPGPRALNGLDLDRFLGSADLVNMRDQRIDDQRFAALCRKVAVDVAGEVKQNGDGTLRPVAGPARRASPSYIAAVYKAVLERADVRDPSFEAMYEAVLKPADLQDLSFTDNDNDLEMASRMSPAWDKDQPGTAHDQEVKVTVNVVTRANRRFILDEIADAAEQIQRDLVEVQKGVVVRMYGAYHNDPNGQDLARKMQKSTGTSGEPSAEAEKYFDYMQKKVREALGLDYYFLNATWVPVKRL